MRRILFIWLAVAALTACGSDEPASSSALPEVPATVDPDLVLCKTDADCIAVPSGCCSCAEGGSATAVNKASRDRWNVHRSEECSPNCCENQPSGDESCAAMPVCDNGACKLR